MITDSEKNPKVGIERDPVCIESEISYTEIQITLWISSGCVHLKAFTVTSRLRGCEAR